MKFSVISILLLTLSSLFSCTSDLQFAEEQEDLFLTDEHVQFRTFEGPTKSEELECWEYSPWDVQDWAMNFNIGTCSEKIATMEVFGERLGTTYLEQIFGHCGRNSTGCARPTYTSQGTITVSYDSNGEFDGNIVWQSVLTESNRLWLEWQAIQGLDSSGRVPFMCTDAIVYGFSLACNNTPNSTEQITFTFLLNGQVTYHCEPCEEDSNEGPGPIGGPGGSCC